MDADGSNPVNLTNTATLGDNELYPSWSPDGSKIAFSGAKRGVLADVFVINADGSNRVQLTTAPDDDVLPRWSPDGSQIIYTANPNPNGWVADIAVMGADGTNPVKLTHGTDQSLDGSWSPDGTRIAFASNRTGVGEIWAVQLRSFSAHRMARRP